MARYALIYGLLSELVIAVVLVGGIALAPRGGYIHSMWFGYLVMLVALIFIFVGVKRYRDVECGGVVRFWRALAVGLAIAGVAALAYVAVWELYLALTHYTFMDDYAASMIRKAEARGTSGAALAEIREEAANMRALYARPLLRMGMTFTEIAPVGVLVALFSAAVLSFSKVLPARR
ncbi:MAG: DUF4199 domain-containing protein [Sphingomonas sp.]|jgi:hypothetical protein|uniref:DUF4199 domain-containing protein n=1 Tax=Sphingomonas sp. TaxID=28214 RepID=UPI003565B174